jgi:hypothetical protein
VNVSVTLCDTDGCYNRARWEVRKGKRIKAVCGKCRDQMVALFGWTFETEAVAR